ncbi:MAG: ABC-2 transporter permease [Gammaproteobacteria bacterium]|nr:ABC-2 transporter permease [Gammaproteobacteria bacterium]
MNTMIALLKREVWEHRSFWIVPSVISALFIFGLGMVFFWVIPTKGSFAKLAHKLMDHNEEALAHIGQAAIPGIAVAFFIVGAVLVTFYVLDSLYSERRDRSILFWKSLPVTDLQTVMSKWIAGFVVLPVFLIAAAVVTTIVVNILFSFALLIGGGNPWTLVWSHFSLFGGTFAVVVGYLVEALWYLPWFAWLMLASAWAKKGPFLWATLPIGAVWIMEEIVFGTNHVVQFLGERLVPFSSDIAQGSTETVRLFGGRLSYDGGLGAQPLSVLGELLVTPGFWGGLIFAAACTAGAVMLRRYRDES